MRKPQDCVLLIVEDEEALRDAVVFDYKRKGFQVLSAGNGKDALELVKANRIDLVISDMRMPGGDGLTLLEKIREYDPKLPVLIFITGFSDVKEEDCIAKGASNVFTKPYDRKALLSVVMEHLGL